MPTFDHHNSPRWRIFNAVATALEGATALQGVTIFRNPRTAPQIAHGQKAVLLRWQSDALVERVGTGERRAFMLIAAGIVAGGAEAEREADALQQVVIATLRGIVPVLNALTGVKEVLIAEEGTAPDLENAPIDVGLVASTYKVTYRTTP